MFINTAQSLETSYSHPVDLEYHTRSRDMTFLTERIKYLSVVDRNSEDIHTEELKNCKTPALLGDAGIGASADIIGRPNRMTSKADRKSEP